MQAESKADAFISLSSKENTSLEKLRYILYVLFYIVSLRPIVISLSHTGKMDYIFLCIILILIMGLTWWRTVWSLYSFIIFIPLISGLQLLGIMKDIPLLSFVFASFYLAWLPKQVLCERKIFLPQDSLENTVDILSGIVLLSLISTMLQYPIDFTLYRFWLPAQGQGDKYYSIEAASILLQGMFFYKILTIEISTAEIWKNIIRGLYIQAVIIALFSVIQILFNSPKLFWAYANYINVGVYSPFADVHSYASYIMVLLFMLWNLSYHKEDTRFSKIALSLAVFLFVCIIMTASKTAWITMIILGSALFVYKSKRKYILIGVLLILVFLIGIDVFSPYWLNDIYSERVKSMLSITQYSKLSEFKIRSFLWHRAFNMLADKPLIGTGIGTFYGVSPSYHPSYASKFSAWHENAHNYYLQIAAELGLPALFLFLYVIFTTYTRGVNVLTREGDEKYIRYCVQGMLFGMTAYLMTCLTGHPLLHLSQQLFFWLIIAAITTLHKLSKVHTTESKLSVRFKVLITVLLIMFLVDHGYTAYNARSVPKEYEAGFYNFEKFDRGIARWTMGKSVVSKRAKGNFMTFEVFAAPHNIRKNGLNLNIYLNGQLWDSVNFLASGWKRMNYFIPFMRNDIIVLQTSVSKTFTPLKLGFSQDSRSLGVAMTEIKFSDTMPQDGVGFYQWETENHETVPDWPKNQPFRFRWTGMRASMSLENESKGGLILFLKCNHPDINNKPVKVKILGDYKLIKEEVFTDKSWRKVMLTADKLHKSKILTFAVNRVWNPRLSGSSEDTRDLGVAVAVAPIL